MQNSFDVNPHSKEVVFVSSSAISKLKFPFHLKGHQLEAVDAWILSGLRGSIIYSSGTGKTEIAFECARRGSRYYFCFFWLFYEYPLTSPTHSLDCSISQKIVKLCYTEREYRSVLRRT